MTDLSSDHERAQRLAAMPSPDGLGERAKALANIWLKTGDSDRQAMATAYLTLTTALDTAMKKVHRFTAPEGDDWASAYSIQKQVMDRLTADLASLRTRITAAEKVVLAVRNAPLPYFNRQDCRYCGHPLTDQDAHVHYDGCWWLKRIGVLNALDALTDATEQEHKHWFIFYRYEKGGERVDDPNSNICAGCGKRVPDATEQGPTGGSK